MVKVLIVLSLMWDIWTNPQQWIREHKKERDGRMGKLEYGEECYKILPTGHDRIVLKNATPAGAVCTRSRQ